MTDDMLKKVDFSPTKSFFVNMLTRDIALEDAILDLLDNCLDGVLRTEGNKHNYEGYYAEITVEKDKFIIKDNCGGIPKEFMEHAFRLGKPRGVDTEALDTIGMYGIGMKRAIFKIGKNAVINSSAHNNDFEVELDDEWMENDKTWEIPVEYSLPINDSKGTEIRITSIRDGIREMVSEPYFIDDLMKAIEQSYSYIIEKGFKVKVNNREVNHNPVVLKVNKDLNIEPYIYQGTIDGVEIDLIVGFYRPIPTEEEKNNELEGKTNKHSRDAGWTVICNDRVVLYRDKTLITGWGDSPVPSYHTQFIGISGVVHFRTTQTSKLPLTTTKRGIDGSSILYLQVKERMKEGMKLFTDYTNRWKGEHLKEGKENIENSSLEVSLKNLKEVTEGISNWTKVKSDPDNQKKYIPKLPKPETYSTKKRITFTKEIDEIEVVGQYIFEEEGKSPSEVGERCFDEILVEAKS